MAKYIKLDPSICDDASITDAELRVLLKLISFANYKTGDDCYPTQQMVADQLNLGLRTINRHIVNLEKKGFLQVEKTRKGNRYNILKGAVFCDTPKLAHIDKNGVSDTPILACGDTPKLAHGIYNQYQLPIPVTNIPSCSPSVDPPNDVAEESPTPAKRKTRKKIQPHFWEPQDMPEEFLEFGREQEFPDKQIIHEYQRFSAYWAARKSEKRPGWLASWRSWLRKCEPNTYRFGPVWRPQDLIDGENRVKIKVYLERGIPRSEWPPAVLAWERFDKIRQEYRAKQALEKVA